MTVIERFDRLLKAMVQGEPPKGRTVSGSDARNTKHAPESPEVRGITVTV
jgi:hypothetical protein